jgi:hypothetical protein
MRAKMRKIIHGNDRSFNGIAATIGTRHAQPVVGLRFHLVCMPLPLSVCFVIPEIAANAPTNFKGNQEWKGPKTA